MNEYRELLRQDAYPGEALWETVVRVFHEDTRQRYVEAEAACRGQLLNHTGRDARVDPYSLFYGSARRAVKYASQELREWWSSHGRVTQVEYFARLGAPGDVRNARRVREVADAVGL